MRNYAVAAYELNRLKEATEVRDELHAIQTRLYGRDAAQTLETTSLISSLQ